MIAGTNTECKILKTEIQDSTAIITLLLFANKTTFPAKAFNIYIQDKEESFDNIELVSENLYWVDYNNSFSNDLNNININKYKEIKINIDITNSNNSKITDNRWLRECYIHLVEATESIKKPAWSSDLLVLVSKEFQLPQVKSFVYHSIFRGTNLGEEYYQLHLDVELDYKSQIDFNYSNKNFYYIVNIYSANSHYLIESIRSVDESLPRNFSIDSSEVYEFTRAVELELIIKNKLNQTVLKYSKIFVPTRKLSNTYIKTKEGIKRVLGFHIKRNIEDDYRKSEWLDSGIPKSAYQSNNILIQPNFNNAAVKLPVLTSLPTLRISGTEQINTFAITISPNTTKGHFYFTIYIDDEKFNEIKINSDYTFNLETSVGESHVITLTGYYMVEEYKLDLADTSAFLTAITLCSETTYCSETLYCNDVQGG